MSVRAAALGIAVLLSGCGAADDASQRAENFEPAYDCNGLADRWADLQQEYVERLGDADGSEFAAGSQRVSAAALWIGQALIEQARDVRAVGCEADLSSGSVLLCDRVDGLQSAGGAGEAAIDLLREHCEP